MTDQEISLMASARLEKALNDIQELADSKNAWIAEVTDEEGDLDEDVCDYEDWDMGRWEWDEAIADAGLRLAEAVRLYMQEA